MFIAEVASLVKSLSVWASGVTDATGLQEIKVVPRVVLMEP